MNEILNQIRKQLVEMADVETRVSGDRFFKEAVKSYGVKTGLVSRLAGQLLPEVKRLPYPEALALCEELLKSDYNEEAFIAAQWLYDLRREFKPSDINYFEHCIDSYINNWAKCDSLCNHALAAFIDQYPQYLSNLKTWAKSPNRWVKRAAAVTLIIPAREGRYLDDVFEIADILLEDQDDMVQKGYGWMLKAASQSHQTEVFDYVMKNKTRMPRTALRYAIEKMDAGLKKKAMEK